MGRILTLGQGTFFALALEVIFKCRKRWVATETVA